METQLTGGTPLAIGQIEFSGEWTENFNTGTEYKMFATMKNWKDANKTCEKYSADGYTSGLVSIETVEERDWLNRRIKYWPTP